MGYRIFYSYQSDINSNLNKIFIRNAIIEAIARIEDFQIEPLIEGFYGSGGNPPPTETMLKQSRKSDIFVGDVTFTSSRIWQSPTVGFSEDANSITVEIAKPANLKPSPNPNVLLETGYSWALKTFNRTILVMNTAFGQGNQLPVDMGSLRWPIGYNLSEDRALKPAKFKKEFRKLVNALEESIREAIISSIEYQIEKWLPCLVYSRWSNDHSFPYFITTKAKEYIRQIRSDIAEINKPIRITGLAGSGKTRIVLEAFRGNGEFSPTDIIDRIIYYDFDSITTGDISKQLSELKEIDQHRVFVADNCTLESHKGLVKHFKKTKVKIITIGTVKSSLDTEGASIFIEEELTHEIFEAIVSARYPSRTATTVIDSYQNNLESFISLIESGLTNDEIEESILESLALLLGEENIKMGALKLLIVISLFDKIGISGEYKHQIEFVRKTFINSTESELKVLIEILSSKKLIKIKGDYILSNGFELELINSWIEDPFGDLDTVIFGVSKNNMWFNFSEKFYKLLEKPEYLQKLKSEGGILYNEDFIDSDGGGKFLNMLAEKFPNIVIDVMERKEKRL